jgi:aminomethyltransferase
MTIEFPLSPRIRKSPYFEATLRWGAKGFLVYNKTYLPMGYRSLEEEFWQTVNAVTLWDVAVQRIVEIRGPDALRFADSLTPRDLSKVPMGSGRYVVITAPDGGIINDPVLLRLAEDRIWLSRADSDLLLWAQGLAVNSGLEVSVSEPDVAPLQVQGPNSLDVMVAVFGEALRELPYYGLLQSEFAGLATFISRSGWSGELGYEIYPTSSSRAEELWETLMALGEPFGIQPAAPNRIGRIEAGILDYSVDMDASSNPFEVGLERLVDLDAGADFIGKQALAEIKAVGIGRKLVGVQILGGRVRPNDERWPVRSDDGAIGELTSCVYSPRLETSIGFVMMPLSHTRLGSRLTIETPDGDRAAVVVPVPFVDPKRDLPEG